MNKFEKSVNKLLAVGVSHVQLSEFSSGDHHRAHRRQLVDFFLGDPGRIVSHVVSPKSDRVRKVGRL